MRLLLEGRGTQILQLAKKHGVHNRKISKKRVNKELEYEFQLRALEEKFTALQLPCITEQYFLLLRLKQDYN